MKIGTKLRIFHYLGYVSYIHIYTLNSSIENGFSIDEWLQLQQKDSRALLRATVHTKIAFYEDSDVKFIS